MSKVVHKRNIVYHIHPSGKPWEQLVRYTGVEPFLCGAGFGKWEGDSYIFNCVYEYYAPPTCDSCILIAFGKRLKLECKI